MSGADLTAAYVRSILNYNPETGIFTWQERSDRDAHWNAKFAGKIAGSHEGKGYLRIWINGKNYRSHRLAWLWMTGEWPVEDIDHRDCDPSNNRFLNLREATNAENMRNRSPQSNNTSGSKGVSWDRSRGKWIVRIKLNGVRRFVGYFDEDKLDEATAAYANAARELHGEFARVA